MSVQNVTLVSPAQISQMQGQITALNTQVFGVANTVVPTVKFILNGKLVTVLNPDPALTLANYIRYNTPFTATKVGCNQGGCGVCTVMLSYKDQVDGLLNNVPIVVSNGFGPFLKS